MAAEIVAYALVLSLLAAWVVDRVQVRRHARLECERAGGHDWHYVSLYGEGVFWTRHCRRCRYQQPCGAPSDNLSLAQGAQEREGDRPPRPRRWGR